MNNTPTDKKILVTGGCGFVGSLLAIEIKKKYPQYEVTVIDNLKRRNSGLNVERLKENGIIFAHCDIHCQEYLEPFSDINVIIDTAADPSVLAGLNGSKDYLIHTNLNRTINYLNLALRNKADFIFLSTGQVYPIKPQKLSVFSNSKLTLKYRKNKRVLESVQRKYPNSLYSPAHALCMVLLS